MPSLLLYSYLQTLFFILGLKSVIVIFVVMRPRHGLSNGEDGTSKLGSSSESSISELSLLLNEFLADIIMVVIILHDLGWFCLSNLSSWSQSSSGVIWGLCSFRFTPEGPGRSRLFSSVVLAEFVTILAIVGPTTLRCTSGKGS